MRRSTASEDSSIPPSRSDSDAQMCLYKKVIARYDTALFNAFLYSGACLIELTIAVRVRLVARCKRGRVYNLSSMRTTLWRRHHHLDTPQ